MPKCSPGLCACSVKPPRDKKKKEDPVWKYFLSPVLGTNKSGAKFHLGGLHEGELFTPPAVATCQAAHTKTHKVFPFRLWNVLSVSQKPQKAGGSGLESSLGGSESLAWIGDSGVMPAVGVLERRVILHVVWRCGPADQIIWCGGACLTLAFQGCRDGAQRADITEKDVKPALKRDDDLLQLDINRTHQTCWRRIRRVRRCSSGLLLWCCKLTNAWAWDKRISTDVGFGLQLLTTPARFTRPSVIHSTVSQDFKFTPVLSNAGRGWTQLPSAAFSNISILFINRLNRELKRNIPAMFLLLKRHSTSNLVWHWNSTKWLHLASEHPSGAASIVLKPSWRNSCRFSPYMCRSLRVCPGRREQISINTEQ